MNIIVVGCGKLGQSLIEQLNDDDNNITVIDRSASRVQAIAAKYDIMGVVGNGAIHTVQQEAGIDNADLLIAVTGSDELNLLCCLIAKKAGNCKTIARVKDPAYRVEAPYLKDELGLAMVINPDAAAAREISRILRFPSAIQIDTFSRGRVELLKFRLPKGSVLAGMSAREVIAKLRCDVLFCTVEREDEAFIVNGNFIFRDGDVISIVSSPENAAGFFAKIGFKTRAVKDVIIVGGSAMAHYLCDVLQKTGIEIKLIEKSHQVCEEFAGLYKDITVICGDATEQDLLLGEGLSQVDAFVTLTNMDEENILLSLFAKSVGAGITLTKINRIDFDDVIRRLDLDSIIYPKNITADLIVRYIRAMKNTVGSNVETLYHIIKDKVEASEFYVRQESAITHTPLSELKFKKNILIAAILRNNKVIIPRGYDVIQLGDSVIIISEEKMLNDITDALM